MKNYADLGGCYPPQPSASADNTLLDLHNSSYHTQPHPIIAKYSLYPQTDTQKCLKPPDRQSIIDQLKKEGLDNVLIRSLNSVGYIFNVCQSLPQA